MQTVANIEDYAKPLVFVNSSASLEAIQTIMLSKGVSHVPIINTNHGRSINAKVVRRKTIWAWRYRNSGANPTLDDVREDALPEVNRSDSLASALKVLDGKSAMLIRGEDGSFTHFLSPRVVANALRDYSEKFQVLEQLEKVIRECLKVIPSKDLANAVKFEGEKGGGHEGKATLGSQSVDLEKLTFAQYQLAFGRLWGKLGKDYLYKKIVLSQMESVREYRNEVMHFRLKDNAGGRTKAKELLGLLS